MLKFIPSFQQIEWYKAELSIAHTNLEIIKKEWWSFQNFRNFILESDADDFLKTIVRSSTEVFYNRNFRNKTEENFEEFITQKISVIEDEKKSYLLETRDETIANILPLYSWQESEWNLTDFTFINYVESLLYTFNLVSDDSIWIGDLKMIESSSDDQIKTPLDSNIFYIPLSLSLVWQKQDILDFLYYMENVWSVDMQSGDVVVYTDNEITKTIQGDERNSDYNIYENQFSDIESLSMRTYIDWSSEPVRGDFISFIKNTQQRERFSIEVDLRFYVQWLPDYKLEKFITNVVTQHSELLKLSNASIARIFSETFENSWTIIKAQNDIRSINNILKLMDQDIKNLNIQLKKKDTDLMNIYESAEELSQKIDTLEKILNTSIEKLNINIIE